MTPYLLISILSGILFGILDGLINANSLAVRLTLQPWLPKTGSGLMPTTWTSCLDMPTSPCRAKFG